MHFSKRADNKELEARALGGLGDAAYAQGKMYSAYHYFLQCLEISEENNLQQVSAANLFMLGTVSIYHNENQRALAAVEKSISTANMVGHKRAEIVSRLTASWILIDWLRLDEAINHIDAGLKLSKEIGAKRFIPFLLESKARYYFWRKEHNKAKTTIEQAAEDVTNLGIQKFIGPWVLSTQALISNNWQETEALLEQGSAILEQGCVGHNYYRFYVHAIEACFNHKKYTYALRFIQKLDAFTFEEKTPWSNFYIERANTIIAIHNNQEKVEQIKLIIEQSKKYHLLTASLSLEESLSDTLSL